MIYLSGVSTLGKKLWPEAVNDFTGFPTADVEIEKIKNLSKIVGGEELSDLQDREFRKLFLEMQG